MKEDKKMKVISLLSMKGGTAKTTTAVNLAAGLANKGFKTLLIDADAQGNATSFFSKQKDYLATLEEHVDLPFRKAMQKTLEANQEYAVTTYEVLMNPTTIKDGIYSTNIENLNIMPSQGHSLILADKNIMLDTKRPQHNRFKKALKEIREEFDYVVIDNAPTSNTVTINSLLASDLVIIPVKPGGDEIEGLASTIEDIIQMEENFDNESEFRVLLTMFHKKNNGGFTRKLEEKESTILKNLFKKKMMNTVIRYQDGIINKSSLNKDVIINQQQKVAIDYKDLVDEVIETLGGENDD